MKLFPIGNFLREDRGQDLIEHALVAAVIALEAVASMSTLASTVNNAFSAVGSKLGGALGG